MIEAEQSARHEKIQKLDEHNTVAEGYRIYKMVQSFSQSFFHTEHGNLKNKEGRALCSQLNSICKAIQFSNHLYSSGELES